jgi:hypothetical protein
MKRIHITLITMLLVLAALPCGRLVAQQAEPAALQRARAGLPPAQAAAFDDILARARTRGLPTGPLVDKVLEGAAKGVAPDRVIAVIRERAERLALAQGIVGTRRNSEVASAALALDRGVDEKVARQLAAGAGEKEPLGMALNVLADLLERGVPVDVAFDVLSSWRSRGARANELQELPAAVERLVREGARPDKAANDVADAVRSGRGASSVKTGVNPQGKPTGPKADRPPTAPRTGPPAGAGGKKKGGSL